MRCSHIHKCSTRIEWRVSDGGPGIQPGIMDIGRYPLHASISISWALHQSTSKPDDRVPPRHNRLVFSECKVKQTNYFFHAILIRCLLPADMKRSTLIMFANPRYTVSVNVPEFSNSVFNPFSANQKIYDPIRTTVIPAQVSWPPSSSLVESLLLLTQPDYLESHFAYDWGISLSKKWHISPLCPIIQYTTIRSASRSERSRRLSKMAGVTKKYMICLIRGMCKSIFWSLSFLFLWVEIDISRLLDLYWLGMTRPRHFCLASFRTWHGWIQEKKSIEYVFTIWVASGHPLKQQLGDMGIT